MRLVMEMAKDVEIDDALIAEAKEPAKELVGMAAHLLIKISLFSSHPGFLLNLSFIS